MSALVVVLGLWALGAVASAWVVVLSRMLTARRESDQRAREDRWWASVRVMEVPGPWGITWYDTAPDAVARSRRQARDWDAPENAPWYQPEVRP